MGNYIGIDGGGTKMLLCLEANGVKHYLKKNFGVNPNDIGYENCENRLIDGIYEICMANGVDASALNGIFAGIAGFSTSDFIERFTLRLNEEFPLSHNSASHDGQNIIYAAFPESDGAIVICGTGSSCFVRKGEKITRIGGYSYFDIDGNGWEIGKRGIAYVLKTYDGREKRSLLCDLIEEKAGGNCLERLGKLLQLPVKQIASFAREVFDAAEKGDENALEIIRSSAKYIAALINRASDYFENSLDVCIAGSVGKNPIMLEEIKKCIKSTVRLTVLNAEPVEGALYKAKTL